ncbi:hypothetical protein Scep_020170 [Stephania cephalantha]|uniref:Uncharacterized protein n=1 Tax=Stephania cephalantha TaxID=152367 RepID=A0AAP0ID61_9MAGN
MVWRDNAMKIARNEEKIERKRERLLARHVISKGIGVDDSIEGMMVIRYKRKSNLSVVSLDAHEWLVHRHPHIYNMYEILYRAFGRHVQQMHMNSSSTGGANAHRYNVGYEADSRKKVSSIDGQTHWKIRDPPTFSTGDRNPSFVSVGRCRQFNISVGPA